MKQKFYVSLEAARLLKEKGYDRECVAYYQHEIFHPYSIDLFRLRTYNKNDAPDYMEQYSAPTKAEAIDWLESKGIVVQTIPSTPNIWRWRMSSMKYIPYDDHTEDSEILYSTRLETEEAAIIKACKLLENGN